MIKRIVFIFDALAMEHVVLRLLHSRRGQIVLSGDGEVSFYMPSVPRKIEYRRFGAQILD